MNHSPIEPSTLKELQDVLTQILGAQNVLTDEPMARHTTFKIGGPADILVTPQSVEQIARTVQLCKESNIPWRVIGLGSNILVSDAGLRGVTIKIGKGFSEVHVEGTKIVAQAGASNASIAATAKRAGLAGYEFAAGIPGTVGGAAIMNAGAYGGEFCQACESVLCLRPNGNVERIAAVEANWSYRHSLMMDDGSIVLEATLQLTPDDQSAIQARMDDLRQRREDKQPLNMPSAGSTFKRPEGYFAGKLIEDAGLRGYRCGGAQVSEKHCGFVVNAGGATAQDVCDLIAHVQKAVYERDGVHMEPEIRMWGF